MSKVEKEAAEIVRAAAALEDEIGNLEAMARSMAKIRLNSEKNIARAASQLSEMPALPERLSERLRLVTTAIGHLQERQQAALEPLASIAVQIQQRSQLLGQHMQTYAALGKAASELNAQLTANQTDRSTLAHVAAGLHELSEGARALFEAASADDFPEIAREADVLKQRLAALRKRLGQPDGSLAN